jgi:uncharacterized protein YwlG (UPF0340 family)
MYFSYRKTGIKSKKSNPIVSVVKMQHLQAQEIIVIQCAQSLISYLLIPRVDSDQMTRFCYELSVEVRKKVGLHQANGVFGAEGSRDYLLR